MKIAILGTGMVGQTIATKMSELGHQVIMGTRNPKTTKKRTEPNQMTGQSFADWYEKQKNIELRSFEQSSDGADLVINATNGQASIAILEQIGKTRLENKILLDIANPLDFSKGMPPSLFVSNTDSLAEQIQSKFPKTRVVKSLNTMNTHIMMHPQSVAGDHTVFMSGNDDEAKTLVGQLLESIGWAQENILDLGDITTARGTESLLPIWLRLWGALGHANFNFHIQQG